MTTAARPGLCEPKHCPACHCPVFICQALDPALGAVHVVPGLLGLPFQSSSGLQKPSDRPEATRVVTCSQDSNPVLTPKPQPFPRN